MNLNLQLKETLRYFLLPISYEKETECVEVVLKLLQKSTIDNDSYDAYLKNKYDDWRFNGELDAGFKFIITEVLKVANPLDGELFAEMYFEIHSSLQTNPFINFELSTITLSHLRLISILARKEKMSSAKISKVLNSVDGRLSIISWKEIQIILRKLNLLPQVSIDEADNLYEIDEELEIEYFADSDIEDSCFLVGEVAKNLLFEYDAEELLLKISKPGNLHIPYLQILHYQCLISGFYDHVLSVPYEFSPRGQTATWLFSKWSNLISTSNPFLNNAKGVDVLDKNWARSRKQNEYENASVLVDLLKGIDGMGYAASQELASWIRQWLIRFIRINSVEIEPIPENLDLLKIKKVLTSVADNPTATYGILEQRFVDVIAKVIHYSSNWRSRGLGDSVNTNNTSRKKLGDNDFQDSSSKEICAYEAHGGKLNKVYYDGHLKTFKRSFERRKEELENISDLVDWNVKVVFIAYDFEEGLGNVFVVDGVKINVEFVKFNDFLNKIDLTSDELKDSFNSLFVEVINNRRTPLIAREKVKSFL